MKVCDNSDVLNFFVGLECIRLVGNGSWLMIELVRLGEGVVFYMIGFIGLFWIVKVFDKCWNEEDVVKFLLLRVIVDGIWCEVLVEKLMVGGVGWKVELMEFIRIRLLFFGFGWLVKDLGWLIVVVGILIGVVNVLVIKLVDVMGELLGFDFRVMCVIVVGVG